MSIIFVDKDRELVDLVKSEIPSMIALQGDIIKIRKDEYQKALICSASNPKFEANGGLDKILAENFPDDWIKAKEFALTENLFFVVSVDSGIKSNLKLVQRALIGVHGYSRDRDIIITGLGTGIGGLDRNEFVKLLKQFSSANLSYANLSSADLSSADLSSANLSSANLSSANLSSANLSYANLNFANLSSANLSSANLSYANLSSANLSYANLSYANLNSANLSSANLSYANLSYANLSYANLSYANLSYANLSYANLSSANLSSANLSSADLSYADLNSANLSYANLSSANLSSADLSYADLNSANLSSANLSSANLSSANLSSANLSSVKGLLNPQSWLKENFKFNKKGLIVFKGFGNTQYPIKSDWLIKKGSVISEECDSCRVDDCGCGVNVATKKWIENQYPDAVIWECLIEWKDLVGVVVPYNTDGKFRCNRLRLIKKVGKKCIGD